MRVKGKIAIALMLVGWALSASAKDLALISNKANSVEAMPVAELVKICKGQTSRWPDGKAVAFVMRDPGSPDAKMVLEKVYGMTKDEVIALIASANHNRVSHPAIIVVDSDDDVVKKVEATPGAVGLVDVYAITGGVTVVRLAGKLPLEQGYLLHGN